MRTEYAVRYTGLQDDQRKIMVVQTFDPLDRETALFLLEDKQAEQKRHGIAPDAELVVKPYAPAERTRPGVGPQIVNVYRDGVYVRQLRHRGTEAQARAKAALQTMHDTHPEWAATVARLRGE